MLDSDIQEICSYVGSSFQGKRVLITGGCGFLGQYFTTVLWKCGTDVKVIDNQITGSWSVPITNIGYSNFDVCSPEFRSVMRGSSFDYIFHLAGIASPYHYRKWPFETMEVATTGLKNVLEIARWELSKPTRVLFFSSSEIYGDPDDLNVPTKESYRGNVSCLGPRACYDESKRLGETICRLYFEQYGLPVMMIRPFNVYGPGMRQDDYRVLPSIASKIVRREPIQIYGTGSQTRTFCYVTDAIRGFLRVALDGVPGEAYNVGNDKPEISMSALVCKIRDDVRFTDLAGLTEFQSRFLFQLTEHPDSYPADEPQRRCPDLTKLKGLGYLPKVTLEDGLQRFFDWALQTYTA